MVVSDHSIRRRFNDLILVAITSKRIDNLIETEYPIEEDTKAFKQSGLVKTSIVRCEYIMTVPEEIIVRKSGNLPKDKMDEIDNILKISLGLDY